MFLTPLDSSDLLLMLGSAIAGGVVAWHFAARRLGQRRTAAPEMQRAAERAAEHELWFATLTTLASAIEVSYSYDAGYLPCVEACAREMAGALALPEAEQRALRVAALVHPLGRLGVPELILHKAGALTPEEEAALRRHPVLAERLLRTIPFPWPVADLVRHHTEHWDGGGYPDGLQGEAIPQGARILAVATTFSALLHPGPFRVALSLPDALAEVESRAGTQFDPQMTAIFRSLVEQQRLPIPTDAPEGATTPETDPGEPLAAIASARRETLQLYSLALAVSGTLHQEAFAAALLDGTQKMIPCAACVLFLPEDDGEFLRAHAAIGVNARHLLGSLARVGTYLTGRAFSRGEMACASFLHSDLILRDVSDAWEPFRSTLIVPLRAGGQAIGTLNLYAQEPDAFGPDVLRVVRLITAQASAALDTIRRFAAVQETAYTDALTGLRNARYLREFLERELNRARREQTPLAVLNIDLDNFKPVNDQFGHARGDQVLREVGALLHSNVRNYDLAARYAGDEFVVVLSRAGRLPAEKVANKLKHAVAQYSADLSVREPGFPKVGISVGIALYPDDADDLQGLLCRSDAAMYLDKRSRNGAPAVR